MDEMNKPASRVEAILQRMLGADTNIEKPASRVEFLLSNVKDLLLAVEDEVEKLEGKTTRLLYSDKTNPTAQEIDAFAIEKGYESPYEGVAVVVSGTYHIWHFYENDNIGWRDDGVDTIAPFTNSVHGSILGSTDDGKIGANQDGTGSVNGWDDLPNRYVQIRDEPSLFITEHIYSRQPLVYGGNYRANGEPEPVNDLGPLPICFDEKANLVMFHCTDSNSDKNYVNSSYSDNKWNTLLGKGNILDDDIMAHNTENLVFGGKNHIYIGVQDSATFGYRNNVYANQAMTHGYKNDNYGGESIVIGNQNQLLGTITVDYEGGDGASSNTKSCAVFGTKNIIQNGFKCSIVSGESNTVNTGCEHDIIVGKTNKIGKKCRWVNIFGDSNDIRNYTTDTTVFGYNNKIYGGVDGTPIQYIYAMGRDNNNKDANENPVGMVFLFGHNLNPGKSDCTVVGAWNAGDISESNAFFSVGTGVESNPRTTFMVEDGNTKLNGTLTMGSTVLTESQLQALLALIPA